ncbi:MAG: hypothetical protein CMM58_05775 [Rhodospirillaceae bacterium]|nr:hypothetical protein [Rhodospirillaceae bacterium]|tara:strand:+ start:2047 stop:2937 length:891 start_codon:yes stop_codon:yes gene_type:complete
MLKIEQTGYTCGAIVHGIDLNTDLTSQLMCELTKALYNYRCLVIKKQNITKERYYKFASEWGELIQHVLDYLRMPDYPEMMTIGNTEKKDKEDAVRNGAAVWHTDGSYIEDPTTITMLYAVRVPKTGGETLIADMVRAYEKLKPELKMEVDHLIAKHYYGRAQFDPDEHKPVPIRTEKQAKTNPVCEKPLVLEHPIAGHRALYAVAHSPFEIIGKTEKETHELLAQLKAHATQPEFVYTHRYEVGDILLFDNLSTMHRAKEQTDVAETLDSDNARLLWRLSAKGIPRVLQSSTGIM